MGTTLEDLRTGLAADLAAAGVAAYAHVPERVTPPVAVVLPDQPYVSQDETTLCGEFRVRLRVCLLGGKGTNELEASAMDLLIVQAVTVLDSGPWDGFEVSEPAAVELNGATYLGTVITLSTLIGMETA